MINHQDMKHRTNRRKFFKGAAFGAGVLAGLPSLKLPLLEADSGSRIEAFELLVLKQTGNQRRVLKVISSTGAAGCLNFPDLDYAPVLGGVAKNHLIGANPFAVEAIGQPCRLVSFVRIGPLSIMPCGISLAEKLEAIYELLGPVRDQSASTTTASHPNSS